MEEYEYEELEEATHNFSPSMLIGKGSHGSVYKAKLKNNQNLVAIKKPSTLFHDDHQNHMKLTNEIQILSSLLYNPNPHHTIKILGTCHENIHKKNKFLAMVIELMPNGSLHDILHASPSSSPPTWPQRIQIALQIARALQFLHESKPQIIHRDIKSANILFDSNWDAKLADFGLAILVQDDHEPGRIPSHQPAGTIGYLDPSYTSPCKLSTKNDVFSFGVVLLEILSGRKVFDVFRSPCSMVEWAMGLIQEGDVMKICDERIGLPLCMEEGRVVREMLHVARSCVNLEEDDRPSMREIVMEIMMMNKSCGVVEKVRYPIWMGFVRSVILMRRRRKLCKKERAKCAYKLMSN